MNCELCGTPVKVVGDTTKHYEPLDMPEMISELICQRSIAFDEARDARAKLDIAVKALKFITEDYYHYENCTYDEDEERSEECFKCVADEALLQITERLSDEPKS